MALEQALQQKRVPWGLLDQFTKQPLVQRELAKKKVENFELRMRTKAEEDPVVAAASIVARAEFVRQMHTLSKRFGAKLQKGAGPLVKEQAAHIIRSGSARRRWAISAKLHFRTALRGGEGGRQGWTNSRCREPKEKVEWSSRYAD